MENSNPFLSPSSIHDHPKNGPSPIGWGTRLLYIPILVIIGLIIGGFLGSIGFLALAIGFDVLLTPPLLPPPNYGQFGMFVIQTAILMALFGAILGLLPLVRWKAYTFLYFLGCAILLGFGPTDDLIGSNFRETPTAAILLLCSTIPIFGVIIEIQITKLHTAKTENAG